MIEVSISDCNTHKYKNKSEDQNKAMNSAKATRQLAAHGVFYITIYHPPRNLSEDRREMDSIHHHFSSAYIVKSMHINQNVPACDGTEVASSEYTKGNSLASSIAMSSSNAVPSSSISADGFCNAR